MLAMSRILDIANLPHEIYTHPFTNRCRYMLRFR